MDTRSSPRKIEEAPEPEARGHSLTIDQALEIRDRLTDFAEILLLDAGANAGLARAIAKEIGLSAVSKLISVMAIRQ